MFVKLTLFPLGSFFVLTLKCQDDGAGDQKKNQSTGLVGEYLSRPRFRLEPLCGFHVGHVSLDLFVVFEAAVFPERFFQRVCHCVRHLLGVSGDVEPASALGGR